MSNVTKNGANHMRWAPPFTVNVSAASPQLTSTRPGALINGRELEHAGTRQRWRNVGHEVASRSLRFQEAGAAPCALKTISSPQRRDGGDVLV